MKKYNVVTGEKSGDQFTHLETDNMTEAIEEARYVWNHISLKDRVKRFVEIRTYESGIDSDFDLTCFRVFTADRQTGNLIEEIDNTTTLEMAIQNAKDLIEEYEADDKAAGTYEEDFYDVVNEDHCSLIR